VVAARFAAAVHVVVARFAVAVAAEAVVVTDTAKSL